MNCFRRSSSRDENSSDISEDIVEELLSYVSGLKSIKEVKAKIEKKCGIKNKVTWSVKDIKQAWRESEMRTSSKRNNWSCVIVLEELKRRVRDDKNNERKEAEPDLKVNEDMQAFGTAQRKENTGSQLFVSNTELKMVGDASQAAELLQNTLITEEKIEQNFYQQQLYIQIPLSDMSEGNQEDYERESTNSNSRYKLINGYPSVNEIRRRKSYVMSYNNNTNNADWVYEILNGSTLANNCEKELVLGDTCYHRGHLAAAANHRWCIEAKTDASFNENKAPQQEHLNTRNWKDLEVYCRKKTDESTVLNVHVYTGTLYCGPIRMLGGKALPAFLYKVLIVENNDGTVEEPECFVFPNQCPISNYFEHYKQDILVFQRDSGLNFICIHPEVTQDRIKSIKWEGKNEQRGMCTANIEVRIS